MAKKDKSTAFSDVLKSIMPILAPIGAKLIIDLVPNGSKLEDILKNYKEYWDKVAPAISTMVLQLTNMPDFADDIVAELSAEVARAIKEKYSADGGKVKKDSQPKGETDQEKIIILAASLDKADMDKFFVLLLAVSDSEQRRAFSNIYLPQKSGLKTIKGWASLDSQNFQEVVHSLCPLPKAKEAKKATVVEEKLKNGFKFLSDGAESFAQDANSFFKEETFLEKLARQVK